MSGRRFTEEQVRAIATAATDPVDGDALLQRFAEAGEDTAWAMFEAVGQLRAGQPVDLGDGHFLTHEAG
jgi:hypothetical protein